MATKEKQNQQKENDFNSRNKQLLLAGHSLFHLFALFTHTCSYMCVSNDFDPLFVRTNMNLERN